MAILVKIAIFMLNISMKCRSIDARRRTWEASVFVPAPALLLCCYSAQIYRDNVLSNTAAAALLLFCCATVLLCAVLLLLQCCCTAAAAAGAVLQFMLLLKYTAAFSTTTPLMYYISMHPMFGMQIEN